MPSGSNKIKQAGQLIKTARNHRGLTQREVMDMIGMHAPSAPQYLMRIEKGLQRLPFNHMDKLCFVLGIKSIDIRRLYAEEEMDKIREKYGLK